MNPPHTQRTKQPTDAPAFGLSAGDQHRRRERAEGTQTGEREVLLDRACEQPKAREQGRKLAEPREAKGGDEEEDRAAGHRGEDGRVADAGAVRRRANGLIEHARDTLPKGAAGGPGLFRGLSRPALERVVKRAWLGVPKAHGDLSQRKLGLQEPLGRCAS